MASLNQIAERIAYEKKDPFNVMLKENIKLSVNFWRATLIRRDVQANGLSEAFLQKYEVELVKVDKADSCNFNLDCVKVLRSKNPIPKAVRLKNDVIYKFVGSVDGKPWAQVEYEEVPYTCYNKFTPKDVRFAIINDYLYVFNNTKLKWARLQHIVEYPNLINTSCTNSTCFTDDSEYPCPADLLHSIVTGIMSGEFRMINPVDTEVQVTKELPNNNEDRTYRNIS